MKLEIYQLGKVAPLTIVECDYWETYNLDVPKLICYIQGRTIAEFYLNNIAGFKEVGEQYAKKEEQTL